MAKDVELIKDINKIVSKYYNPAESKTRIKAKKQIAYLKNLLEALERYLPERLVKKVSIEPEKIRVEGERRTVTILFADLTGFTAMSETMDPEDVVQIVNEYFTRMLEESNNILKDEGFTVLKGDSYSYTSNIAYYPFKELLLRLFNLSERENDEEKRKKVREFLSKNSLGKMETRFIPTILGLETEDTIQMPPEVKKKHIFDSVKNLILVLSAKPLCLKFEDLQWADNLTIELISFISDEVSNNPLLLLCTYRPEFAFPSIAKDFTTNISLKNLEKENTVQYLKAIFDDRKPSEEISELVFKHTKGNPLYIEELTRNLIKRRLLKRKKVKIEFRKSPESIRIPETINSIVMERVDRMSEMDQKVLRIASIVGQTFTLNDIAYLLQKGKADIIKHLESLEHFEGMINSIKNGSNHKYRFNSPTVREVIYNAMLKRTRVELHKRYGAWLLRNYKDNPYPVFETLAYHFVNGGDIEKGIQFSKLSGEKARNYFANEAGIKFFNDALSLLKKTEMTEEKEKIKLEILRRQGYFFMMTGDMKNALLNQKRSLRLANKLKSEKDRIMSLINIGMLYDKVGDVKKPVRYYRKARKEAKDTDLLPLLSMIEINSGLYYKKIGEFKKALKNFNKAIEINRIIKIQ